jgi:hypothetical protein
MDLNASCTRNRRSIGVANLLVGIGLVAISGLGWARSPFWMKAGLGIAVAINLAAAFALIRKR